MWSFFPSIVGLISRNVFLFFPANSLCLSGSSDISLHWACCFPAFPDSQSWSYVLQQCSNISLSAVLYLVKVGVQSCWPLFWPLLQSSELFSSSCHFSWAKPWRIGGKGIQRMGWNNKIPAWALILITVVRAGSGCLGCSCSRTTGGADREEHDRAVLLEGTGAGLLGFTVCPRAPGTEASSHLPWVEEQEVPQPSQVLYHLKKKPPGQDATCTKSLKTKSLLLYETKTVKKGFKTTIKK